MDSNRTTRHNKWRPVIPDVDLQDTKKIFRKCLRSCRIERLVTTNEDPSYRMSICRTIDFRSFHALRTWEVHVFFCKSTSGMTDRHLLWRVVRFESNRVESLTLLHCIVYNILTMDFRSFHALRTLRVHVVMFSYHATSFHSLDFRYVNARFDFRHTIVIPYIAYASRLPVC